MWGIPVSRDNILERYFFLVEVSCPLRLEFLSGFLPSFFCSDGHPGCVSLRGGGGGGWEPFCHFVCLIQWKEATCSVAVVFVE